MREWAQAWEFAFAFAVLSKDVDVEKGSEVTRMRGGV